MKIVLVGTPEISVKAFEEVIKNFEVLAVVTQPDKPKGRGMQMQETPVAELAKKYNIKLFKPEKIGEIKDELAALGFDLLLTFAFGQYVPTSVLSLGKYKPLNIHGSLLPKYRGAAPIHYAILNGDKEIGITLMEMVKEMDAGDMYFKASQSIGDKTTTGEAFEIISNLAANNIVPWLEKLAKGEVKPEAQPSEFSLSPKIDKSFGELSSELTTYEIERKIRGLNPFPGVFIFKDGLRVKIFNFSLDKIANAIEFKTKDGVVYFNDYQFEGRKRVVLNG